MIIVIFFFFFNGPATTEIYTYCHTLSRHDALPIYGCPVSPVGPEAFRRWLRRNSFSAQLATAHLSGFVAKGLIGEFVTCGQFVTREPGGEEIAQFPCRRRFRRVRGKVHDSMDHCSEVPVG